MRNRANYFYQSLNGSNAVLTATSPSNSRANLFAITPTSRQMKQITSEFQKKKLDKNQIRSQSTALTRRSSAENMAITKGSERVD
jgi:hypothetical protein